MQLQARLNRLEARWPKPEPTCPGCGYPITEQQRVVLTNHRNPLPICQECERPLYEGKPLAVPYKRIIRQPHLAGTLEV